MCVQEGISSSFGEVYVFSNEEYEKATATNVVSAASDVCCADAAML